MNIRIVTGLIKKPIYTNQKPYLPIIDFPRDESGDKRRLNPSITQNLIGLSTTFQKKTVFFYI